MVVAKMSPKPWLVRIPGYVWTLLALALGFSLGCIFPEGLKSFSQGVATGIRIVVTVVPVLIFAALSPAIASLVRAGRSGRFAAAVFFWYVLTSAVAGLFGAVAASLIFKVPWFPSGDDSFHAELSRIGSGLMSQPQVSLPLMAIAAAVICGLLASRLPRLERFLLKLEEGLGRSGRILGWVMIPVVACLGVALGVQYGASLGASNYLQIVLYTGALCLVWLAVYSFAILRFTKRPAGRFYREYAIPTGLFAAGTCSSLATLPVSLDNIKRYGVKKEIADFIIPVGAIVNLDASALAYVAYAPFVLTHLMGLEVSWMVILFAWPIIVLFTVAAPGLPAGMGTALWSATLFASLLQLEDPEKAVFVMTWISLSSGIPDMFRTATNSVGDGLSAVLFDTLTQPKPKASHVSS